MKSNHLITLHYLILMLAFLWPATVIYGQEYASEDCTGAIPVCQKVYVQEQSPIGFGGEEEINPAINCIPFERSSVWYIFTVNQSGKFGFLLTPEDSNDDFDWALFNLTTADCKDIFDDASLLVSCNAAGNEGCNGPTGATGGSAYKIQGANCNNDPPNINVGNSPFNDFIDVIAGNTYVLLINNFSGTTGGYTIDFGLSTDIGIFDETPPVLKEANLEDVCAGDHLVVNFSEFIQCNTIDASNFRIEGTGGPFSLVLNSDNCEDEEGFSKTFTLSVTPSLPGNESFILHLEVDGASEALDLCGNPSNPVSINFPGPGQTNVLNFGNDTVICPGDTIVLEVGGLQGSYLWQDGATQAQYLVRNPGTYSVTVSTDCGTLQDEIIISPPAALTSNMRDTSICNGGSITWDVENSHATYLWQDGSTQATFTAMEPGSYSVTITDGCSVLADTAVVSSKSGQLDPLDLGMDTFLCSGDSIRIQLHYPNSGFVWQNGSTDSSFTITSAGTYAVTVTNACGTLQDELQVSLIPPIVVDIQDTLICSGGSIQWDVSSPNATYLWQDGSTQATFTAMEPGSYSVTITDGCSVLADTAVVSSKSGQLDPLDLGMDTFLCSGDSIRIQLHYPNSGFVWQNGSTDSSFTITSAGTYAVTVTNACGTLQDELQVSLIPSIVVDIQDTLICSGGSIQWDVSSPNATYLWQDGSTGPTYTASVPGIYKVVVSNACESVESIAEVVEKAGQIPHFDLGRDTTLCPQESLNLSIMETTDKILWQDGSSKNDFLADKPGVYSVRVSNECGNFSDSIKINFVDPIVFDLGRDTFLCPGEVLVLTAENKNASYYIWQDNSDQPTIKVSSPGEYSVIAGNQCGEIEDKIVVAGCTKCKLFVPNAISPNGDGVNDYFQPFTDCQVEKFDLKIFDRWGSLVYETTDPEAGWNFQARGRVANVGVYVWILDLQVLENGDVKNLVLSGDLSILK